MTRNNAAARRRIRNMHRRDQLRAQDDAVAQTYDPATNTAYQQAKQAAEAAKQAKPTYSATYDQPLQQLYAQITQRPGFTYDPNSDGLYRQYRDSYTHQGRLAMMDTMGEAAGLTGGYGSSYSQAAGQQAYNQYLTELNALMPELYDRAYQRYSDEGTRLMEQYGLLSQQAQTEYDRYLDSLGQYWNNLNYHTQQADTEYQRGYDSWYQQYQESLRAENTAYDRAQDEYKKQQSAYARLQTLITETGYVPTEEELEAAGMSQREAAAYKKVYTAGQTPVYRGGGGSSKKKDKDEEKTSGGDQSNDVFEEVYAAYERGSSSAKIVKVISDALRAGRITQYEASKLEKKYTHGI